MPRACSSSVIPLGSGHGPSGGKLKSASRCGSSDAAYSAPRQAVNVLSSLQASMTTDPTGMSCSRCRSTCSMTAAWVFHSFALAQSRNTQSGSSRGRPAPERNAASTSVGLPSKMSTVSGSDAPLGASTSASIHRRSVSASPMSNHTRRDVRTWNPHPARPTTCPNGIGR